jgi:GAF domain-containing protein
MTPSWRVRWAVPTALLLLVLLSSIALALLAGAPRLAVLPAAAVALLAVTMALLHRQLQLDAAQSQVLLQVSRDLASRLEVGELFDDIVQAIVRLVPLTSKCVIHLLDEERQKLYPRYSSQPAWQHSLGMPLGKGIAGQALQELRTIAIADVRREAGFLPLQSSSDLRALLVAPLHVQGRLMGTISLNSALPGAFTRRDEILVTTLAAQASAALRQAQLREDAQREAHYIAALMNNLEDGLVVLDAQRRILRHNP